MWERCTRGYALALFGVGGGADTESWTPSLAGPAPALLWEAVGWGGVQTKPASHG